MEKWEIDRFSSTVCSYADKILKIRSPSKGNYDFKGLKRTFGFPSFFIESILV